MFAKKKFNETHKDISIHYPTTANAEIQFLVLTFLSSKLRSRLIPNSLDKLMTKSLFGHHFCVHVT